MKFAEHLAAHITPEWRKQYVQYEAMKDQLYLSVEQAPSAEVTDEETIQRYFARFDEDFLQFCDKELLKINTFFSEKLAEANRKIENLKSELAASEQISIDAATVTSDRLQHRRSSIKFIRNKKKKAVEEQQTTIRKMHDIKLAFSEFYLSLILLQNYQTLNFTGFRKILKKHDKLMSTDTGAQFRQANVETATFYISKHVDHLIKDTESVFTQRLEGGDRQKAMKRLRVPPLGEVHNPWTTFRVGLFAGVFMVLVSAAILGALTTEQKEYIPALRMYRAVFLVILCCFLLGINTYGWSSSGVNHVLIFELDPRDHLTHQQLLEISGFFAVIWALSLLSFLYSHETDVPAYANPLCIVGFCFLYLINPVRVLHYKARMWLLRVLFRIFTAPFHHVGFADFWLADQLNSLASVLLDFEFFICYYAKEVSWHENEGDSGFKCGDVKYAIVPIVSCLPAWFRFAQCLRRYRDTRMLFPHIVNAGKYSTTFFVVLFKSLHKAYDKKDQTDVMFFYLWMAAQFISTCYTFTWDIKMDWGLFDKNAGGENRFLREETVYAYKGYYYFAIIQDFVLRFAWVIHVVVGKNKYLEDEVLKSIFAPFEVFRRFIWNFFRLENEHLNNCGQFRAVRDISIVPIDANDQQLLETMMDEEDGVVNRRKGGERQKLLSSGRLRLGHKAAAKTTIDDDEEEV